MAMKKIDLGALQQFDGGRIAAALDAAIQRCVSDCQDRPHLDKARTVALEIEIEPVPPDNTGDLCTVYMTFRVKDKVPLRATQPYSVGVKKNGTLFYNEDAPDNVDQTTLLPDDE